MFLAFNAFFSFFFFFYIEKHWDVLSVCPVHHTQDPQTSFFIQTFIKNESYDTIHTFKNYFTTVFLVFNFQQNKPYLNTPFIYLIHHFTIHPTSMLLFFRTQLNTIHLFIILSLSLQPTTPWPLFSCLSIFFFFLSSTHSHQTHNPMYHLRNSHLEWW